jgi:hypothetical protein
LSGNWVWQHVLVLTSLYRLFDAAQATRKPLEPLPFGFERITFTFSKQTELVGVVTTID